MKLIIFALPQEVELAQFIEELNQLREKLNFTTKVNVLDETDLENSLIRNMKSDFMKCIDHIVKCCGNPNNIPQITFMSNFYSHLSYGFGMKTSNVKALFESMVDDYKLDVNKKYIKSHNYEIVMEAIKNTLSMMR